ncbi:MAG TPA: hypothetical protein GX701_07995 [Clostridiales bacterium]|nr:hypothetical protein [Clostridiales bacterium]
MHHKLGRLLWDKPVRHAAVAISILLFCFLLGLLSGVIAAYRMSPAAKIHLTGTLRNYVLAAEAGTLTSSPLSVILSSVAPPLLILLLGTVPAGTLGIPLVFAWQGFHAAYGVAAIARLPGVSKGLLAALSLSGGRLLFMTLSLTLAGLDGLMRSMAIRRMAGGTMLPQKQYLLSGAIALVPAILAVVWEIILTPRLAAWALPFFITI